MVGSLLETTGSASGQRAFNALKGLSPIRSGVARPALDPIAQATLDETPSWTMP